MVKLSHVKEEISMQGLYWLFNPSYTMLLRSYCWMHGTRYIKDHLQGKATGCFVDSNKLESEFDAPVTAYYLWLPFLLASCFIFAKFSRSIWKNFLEGGLIKNIIGAEKDANTIAENFLQFRSRFFQYHCHFAFCELLNLIMVVVSMFTTDCLLRSKFLSYGIQVIDYIWTMRKRLQNIKIHNPMCEIFPTEVSCFIQLGASTGAIEGTNYICLLSNNLFNQYYFFILWIWWCLLIFISTFGLIYRVARIMIPGLSRSILYKKLCPGKLNKIKLSSSDAFVLDIINENLTPQQMEKVLEKLSDQGLRSALNPYVK